MLEPDQHSWGLGYCTGTGCPSHLVLTPLGTRSLKIPWRVGKYLQLTQIHVFQPTNSKALLQKMLPSPGANQDQQALYLLWLQSIGARLRPVSVPSPATPGASDTVWQCCPRAGSRSLSCKVPAAPGALLPARSLPFPAEFAAKACS